VTDFKEKTKDKRISQKRRFIYFSLLKGEKHQKLTIFDAFRPQETLAENFFIFEKKFSAVVRYEILLF